MADERFEQAVELLSRNGSIKSIEHDIGEVDAEGNITSVDCRVTTAGIYRPEDVRSWLTMRDENLGVKTVPSDTFEKSDNEMVTYVGIHDIDEDVGADPDY